MLYPLQLVAGKLYADWPILVLLWWLLRLFAAGTNIVRNIIKKYIIVIMLCNLFITIVLLLK